MFLVGLFIYHRISLTPRKQIQNKIIIIYLFKDNNFIKL